MATPLQPLLHDRLVVLRAPAQAWSANDGSIGGAAIDGIYVSDVRIVSQFEISIDGVRGEHVATSSPSAHASHFVALHRGLDDPDPDPDTRSIEHRTVTPDGLTERLEFFSRLSTPVDIAVVLELRPDVTPLEHVKAGTTANGTTPAVRHTADGASWSGEGVTAQLTAPGATIVPADGGLLRLEWDVRVPARGSAEVAWSITAEDADAVVTAPSGPPPWSAVTLTTGDERLERWVRRALEDLDSLRLETADRRGDQFLAAGAPWFFTLFGRDSLWSARFLLPLGTELAAGTLRVLAGLQGTTETADTAEQPGKIMHELRRAQLDIPGDISLPPLYYGTVDATPLWVCLLHDAWRWGMPEDEVRALLPNLRAALAWMRDFGDSDGDGLLEYVDTTGHGLSNQGWKDSGDSVQWRDGRLAEGPIALCEVQAYAFEAATHGADLLEHFGESADEWRAWAGRLKARFDDAFWIDDPDGAYPAIALDAQKRAVDTVTSNLGHLLGTGLLDTRQSRLVAHRLGSPELDSGYGLRTMSTASAGYWPLSYHGGTVWAHDTAIAILGLAREGHREVADALSRGLLAAVSGFDYRVPELHSGDSADQIASPVPYPAACRPQAWSAAAAIAVLSATLRLQPEDEALSVSPSRLARNLAVDGIRFRGGRVSLRTDDDAEITASSGAPILVG